MSIRSVNFSLISTLTLALLVAAPLGAAPPPQANRPKVEFDEQMTPLQRAVDRAVEERKERERGNPDNNGRCNQAIEENDPDDIAMFCKVPHVGMKKLDPTECGDCGEIFNPAGQMVGKRIRTETTLDYSEPGQRGIPDENGEGRWQKVMVERPRPRGIGNGVSDRGLGRAGGARVHNSVLFPEYAVNEDRDCIDTVTGERFGGYVGGQIPADGDPASCFDASGELKRTLEVAAGGCRHAASGEMLDGDMADFLDDPCFDERNELKTSLIESIDEDGPENLDNDNDGLFAEDPAGNGNEDNDCIDSSGIVQRDAACFDASGALLEGKSELIDEDGDDLIDDDRDGRINEDAPAADALAGCRDFGSRAKGLPPGLGDVMPDGECDLTRAMIVEMNRQAMMPVDQGGLGLSGKVFLADDQGNYDPSVAADLDHDGTTDSVEFGRERRRIKLSEAFTLKCQDPAAEMVDGQCVSPPADDTAALAADPRASSSGLVQGRQQWTDNGDGTRTLKQYMMMGFTFAPPVLEWGYRVEEYACIDLLFGEVCFEVFFARIGYEFDFAVGLRLPVEVEVSDIPSDAVLAGQQLMLNTKITPVDFTAKQYEQFCEENDLADGLLIADCERFSFPNFFDTLNPFTPEAEVDGDEFVAHELVFAGLIVRVIGIPIIGWGIDSAVDLPTMCSLVQTHAQGFDLVQFGSDLAADKPVLEALKNQLINCGSFTTPFGLEQDPLGLPGVERLRAFPFSA
ncbi:MAG TPA: hypothetical protein VD788_07760, partial [Candidatus Polarisedimenticolaceae bacterium]|nr:hypothetical protein [Candidatus Polarisedimenticolaceae bacterium]